MTAPSTILYFHLLVIDSSDMSIIQNFMTNQIADDEIINVMTLSLSIECTTFDESQYP